jgi:hypothetical protein
LVNKKQPKSHKSDCFLGGKTLNFELLLEKCEIEYSEQLDRIESIKLAHQEFHKQAWELDKRNREIALLQDKLSDAHNALFQERTHLFRVIAENDGLKGKDGGGGGARRRSGGNQT